MKTKLIPNELTFRKYQRQYLSAEMMNIRFALKKKLEKAFESGAIPDHWKETGNYLCMKAVIDSFCRDRPYSMIDTSYKKESENLHLFI